MFLIVRSRDRAKNQTVLQELYEKLSVSWDCEVLDVCEQMDCEDTILILYVPNEHGVMGFARLSPLSSKSDTWCCDLVEMFDSCQSMDHQMRLVFIYWFYEGLYECLYNFSLTHKVDKVLSSHFEEEHEDIKFFGRWPFVDEFQDDEEKHHGILLMNDDSYTFYQGQRAQMMA